MSTRLGAAGLVLLAGSWGFIDGFFVRPRPAFFVPIFLAGLACVAAGWPADGPVRLRGRAIREGAWAACAIVALHLALQLLLPGLLARLHRIPVAASPAAALLRILGIGAGTDFEGNLLVRTAAGTTGIALTWELAGLPMIVRVLVAVWAADGGAALPRHLLRIALTAGVRTLVLVAAISGGARVSLAFEPAVTLLTFLPLALAGPFGRDRSRATPGTPTRRLAAGVALLALAGAGLGLRLGHGDPGTLRAGRVLIDESRSDWEWTTPAFDHARYGQRSLYSYSLWRAWIELHFDTRVIAEPPTEEDLARADVLVIKTPTTPYDAGTIARIERFVRGGGGLYLVGDHTNLFGMSTVLNEIAAPYGLSFEHDDTFPLDHEQYDLFEPGWLAPHPVLRGIDSYPFETSCTLRAPWSAELVMVGRRLGAEMVDYGHVNFFGNIRLDPSERFGLFPQAALVRHGHGRVAAFSDSTNFSNFSMLWPGRRRLTLNLLDWLARDGSDVPQRLAAWLGVLSALAGVAGARLVFRGSQAVRAAGCWVAVLCFMVAAHESSRVTERSLGSPRPREEIRVLPFDTRLGDPRLNKASPVLSREAGPSWWAFNALFIDAARSGIWPEMTDDLPVALARHGAVIVVNPVRSPSRHEFEQISAALERGASLLVIDSIMNARSTSAEILAPFGLAPDQTLVALAGGHGVVPAITPPSAKGIARRSLRGGGTLVWRAVGRGRVALVLDGALFSDRGFGGVYVTPTRREEEIHRGQEELIGFLLEPPQGETGDPD